MFSEPKSGKSQFCDTMKSFSEAMIRVSVSAEEATAAFNNLMKEIRKTIPKEIKSMALKLGLLKARLHTLEGRNTECDSIRKKLRRQIRNLENKLSLA